MTRNICLFILFLLIHASNIFSQNIFELKGKSIIIPPITKPYENCVYTEQVLDKYKFKPKYLYSRNILGEKVDVIDVKHINKGKKKEAILLIIDHKSNKVVLHMPMCGILECPPSGYESNYLYLGFYPKIIEKDKFFTITFSTQHQDVVLYHYDANLLDSINQKFKGKYIYLKNKSYTNMAVGEKLQTQVKYKFKEIKFSEDYTFSSPRSGYRYNFQFKGLSLILESSQGELSIPIKIDSIIGVKFDYKYRYYNFNEGMYLSTFEDFFETEEEYIEDCKKQYNTYVIKNLKQMFEGKEVYVNSNNNIPKGYYHFKEITLSQSTNKEDIYFKYYALLEDIENKRIYKFPIVENFDEYIVYAEEQRKIEAEEARKQAEEEAKRKAEIEKEERKYKANLIRKFGEENARLILKGSVKIGFTKEMCIEAWGKPYDINRTVTSYGVYEQWVYDIGCYLYFEGNILTTIQN